MSVKLVTEEIRRFLQSPEPEVICIMGKWGVGKTFAWTKFLKQAVADKIVKFERYSYVSLFGQYNLEGLKHSIFEGTLNINDIKDGPSLETFHGSLSKLENAGRSLSKLFRYVPQLKDYLPGLFLTVRNQIVCIDDLERIGEGLSTKNVLGLVSYLKEQSKCKVVLLLNDEEMTPEAATEFRKQLEKVIDVEIRFEPTANEAASIGIDKTLPFYDKFKQISVTLGITNIRILRKIQRLATRLHQLLSKYDDQVFESALTSLMLFGWTVYQSDLAPSIAFIKTFDFYRTPINQDKQETPEETQWRVMLSSLGFQNFDEFDALILKSIQNGYFDESAIEKAAKQFEEALRRQNDNESFHAAWEKYHGSLSTGQEEVLDELYNAFIKSVLLISPTNADGTITLFRILGRDKQADELIKFYIDNRNESKSFFDPENLHFGRIQDPKFADAVDKKFKSYVDDRDPKDVLMKLAMSQGWNPEDIDLLSNLSVDQYYTLFKTTTGNDLSTIIRKALHFGRFENADEQMKAISSRAKEALIRIGDESAINKERIKVYI